MQTLLLPAVCSGTSTEAGPYLSYPQWISLRPLSLSLNSIAGPSLSHPKSLGITHQSLPFPSPQSRYALRIRPSFSSRIASSSIWPGYTSPAVNPAKLAQVAKRLEKSSRYFKRLGSIGLLIQLVCTVAAAVMLSLSMFVTGRISSLATYYATAGGIATAFISVFFSLRYVQLSQKLKTTANDPPKAPTRADVVECLKNSIAVNIFGMGLTFLGMQAKIGSLVAKALTTTPNPSFPGFPPGSTPVLAIDVFLVQASVNAVLAHFLGFLFSLQLLRFVTQPYPENTKLA